MPAVQSRALHALTPQVHSLEGGNHSLAIKGDAPARAAAVDGICGAVVGFVTSLAGSGDEAREAGEDSGCDEAGEAGGAAEVKADQEVSEDSDVPPPAKRPMGRKHAC